MTALPSTTTDAPVPPATVPTADKTPDHNRTNVDYRKPMPRPKVRGLVTDFHSHLHAARHGQVWFEAADHYGIDRFVTMTPLEEALGLQRDWPGRLHYIAIPKWGDWGDGFIDQWRSRIEAFYNIGSRIVKFWFAPPAIGERQWRLDSDMFRPLLQEAVDRGMAIMTHIGDPEIWYQTKYTDTAKYGTRDDHYQMWENVMSEFGKNIPWIGAHLGGNPENLQRLQSLLDRYPNLRFDCSATRWIVREVSSRRDEARDFFLRNQERILFGSDQVSIDGREFDFLASRFWVQRRLWESARNLPSPIRDPDFPEENQPMLRGLALPDEVLQKLYHDNAAKLLDQIGATFGS